MIPTPSLPYTSFVRYTINPYIAAPAISPSRTRDNSVIPVKQTFYLIRLAGI